MVEVDDSYYSRGMAYAGKTTNDTSLPTGVAQGIVLCGKFGLQVYLSPVKIDPEKVYFDADRIKFEHMSPGR